MEVWLRRFHSALDAVRLDSISFRGYMAYHHGER